MISSLHEVQLDLLRQEVRGRFSRTSPITLPVDSLQRWRAGAAIDPRAAVAPRLAPLVEILELAYGCSAGGPAERPYRRAPSAGGLYPTEVLLLCRQQGRWRAYYYHFPSRGLFPLSVVECDAAAAAALLELREEDCAVVLLSVLWRTVQRYNVRGHRYCLLDAGTVADNLAVASALRSARLQLTAGSPTRELEQCLGLHDGEVVVESFACRLSSLAELPARRPEADVELHVEAAPRLSPSLRRAVDVHRRSLVRHHRPPSCRRPAGPITLAALAQRRSVKSFSPAPLPRAALQAALAAVSATPRSASALACLALVARVDGCEPGIYHDREGQLRCRRPGSTAELARLLAMACQGQALLQDASFTLFVLAERAALGDAGAAGYRHTVLEAGMICEGLYRLAAVRRWGTTTIGGFSDEAVAALLDAPTFVPLVGQAFGRDAGLGAKLDADTHLPTFAWKGD